MTSFIIGSAAILGALGLLFGILLAVASRFFGVEADTRVIQVRESLPGANCGGCGYAGCGAFAEAVVAGKAPVNGCPVNTAEGASRIAAVMNVDSQKVTPLIAMVECRGTLHHTHKVFEYEGLTDCAAAAALDEGYKACRFSCMGMGNCVRVCPTSAVSVVDGLAVIDHDKCITCGKCVSACPRGIIRLVPANAPVLSLCSSNAKGKAVREACDMGCIGCAICENVCKFGAIKMVGDLPVIDYAKCVGCMQCVEKCPRKCLLGRGKASGKTAFVIEEKCTGCTLCDKTCKFGAVHGANKAVHRVDPMLCTGCALCVEKCPQNAISMINK